jgi:hypothetical protein
MTWTTGTTGILGEWEKGRVALIKSSKLKVLQVIFICQGKATFYCRTNLELFPGGITCW